MTGAFQSTAADRRARHALRRMVRCLPVPMTRGQPCALGIGLSLVVSTAQDHRRRSSTITDAQGAGGNRVPRSPQSGAARHELLQRTTSLVRMSGRKRRASTSGRFPRRSRHPVTNNWRAITSAPMTRLATSAVCVLPLGTSNFD